MGSKKMERHFYLEATRADGSILDRVDATGWPDAHVRGTVLGMLFRQGVDHVHEAYVWVAREVPAEEPVVICTDPDGTVLTLGPNQNDAGYLLLAWTGSLLVEDCAVGLPRTSAGALVRALLPHLSDEECRQLAAALPNRDTTTKEG